MRTALLAVTSCLSCAVEHPPVAEQSRPDIVLTGTTTDCIPSFRVLVRGVNVMAFDPVRHPGILKLLRAMDSVDVNVDGNWPKQEALYSQVLKLADTATALSRDTSEAGGVFSLRSPSRDSILLFAYADDEDFYYEYKMVGGQTSSNISIDMAGCNLPPDAPVFVPPPDTSPVLSVGLTCTPDTLRQGDTLSLVMPVPHGQQLALTQPDGTWFYLIQPGPLTPPNYSAVPSDSFRTMSTYRIPTNFRWRPFVSGRDTLEAVFAEPGKYTVFMGEQLASDHAPPFAKCQVTFK